MPEELTGHGNGQMYPQAPEKDEFCGFCENLEKDRSAHGKDEWH